MTQHERNGDDQPTDHERDWLTEPRTRIALVGVVCLTIVVCFWIVNSARGDAADAKEAAVKSAQALSKVNSVVSALRVYSHQQCLQRQHGVLIGNKRAAAIREFLTIAQQARTAAAEVDTDPTQRAIDLRAAARYAGLRAQVEDSPPVDCRINPSGDVGGA